MLPQILKSNKDNRFLLMTHLHWRGLYTKTPKYYNMISPSLLALAIRIISTSIALPKVAKASTSMLLLRVIVAGIITIGN